MRPARLASLAAAPLAALALAGCIRVEKEVYVQCDAAVIVQPPVPVHAQALIVVDLARSAANLVGAYGDFAGRISAELAARNVIVDEYAILPLYGAVTDQPALVFGESSDTGGSASSVLGAAATSGRFDRPVPGATAEQHNLYDLGRRLDTATLPPELTNGQSRPFFSPPGDRVLFLVITIHPGRRLCAHDDAACALGGRPPSEVLAAAGPDRNAEWLKLPGGSYPPSRIYHVHLTTSEAEDPSSFSARCSAVPGFPRTLLDVMAPSPAAYYGPLTGGLGSRGVAAEQLDMCDALGSGGRNMLQGLAGRIAARAGR